MKCRLVIITEIIAPYRIPVFNALACHDEIDLHVIFLAQTDPAMRQWRVYSDEIRFSYEVLPSWRGRLGSYNVLLNRNVPGTLHARDPDVILCGGYNYLASWQALRWARRNGVPFVLWCESTAHDQRSGSLVLESLKQNFFNKCSGFVVPGASAKEYVEQLAGCASAIFVAPNAVDNDLFAAGSDSARANASRVRGHLGLPARYVLFVGRLVKAKGVLELLDAYASLPEKLRSQLGLVFAGDGPLRADLELKARMLSPGLIHFAGFVQRDELASYYGLAECLAFPTYSDTWGMVVNEAMACGLPIVSSCVAGCTADLVSSNGIVVAPRNSVQLSRAIQQIAADPVLRENMSFRSQEIIQRYSPQMCAAGIAKAALEIKSFNVPSRLENSSFASAHKSGIEVGA